MKRKGLNIILIAGMLVIWGFVAKKALFYFGKDKREIVTAIPAHHDNPIAECKKDTFELYSLGRDPFLDIMTKKKSPVSRQPATKNKKKSRARPKVKPTSKWPKLQYFGYLKGDAQATKLAMIKIDNKLHKLRERKSIEDIQVLKIYKDSILLKRDGSTKMVFK